MAGTMASLPGMALARDFEHPASSDTAQQFAPGNVQRQDTPNDPVYDQAEPDTLGAHSSTNLYDERFDLFGFPSALTSSSAVYRDGPHAGQPQISGINAAGAWKIERGRPDVTVAILDTGIKWDNLGLRLQVHLNPGELPYPQHDRASSTEPGARPCSQFAGGTYDADGDGAFTVADYGCDSRVSLSYPGRLGPPGLITGQDLLHAFGSCQIVDHLVRQCPSGGHFDNDGNGYANDIVGWNFFDNNNDPTDRSSYFAAANHGSGRAENAVERGNDSAGSIGVCPHCQVMPVRIWDTFVSDANDFALGITYATDRGAQVIEGANGSLYHSAFAEAASQYAYDHGAVQVFSGDDLNTADHNYPGNYGHALLVQGTNPDTVGLGSSLPASLAGALRIPLGTELPVQTYFRGPGTTQYGGKSSLATEGATGSENTGKAAGAAGLVVSAALDHGIALRPDETREILEQTAERVTAGDELGTGTGDLAADPSAPRDRQWTEHFGWGRVNLGDAVAVAASGRIPPTAAIDAPDWYAPLTGASLTLGGRAQARGGGPFHYRVTWAPGLQPDPSSWRTVSEGDSSAPLTSLGTIDLTQVRQAVDSTPVPADPGGPTFSPSALNPLQHQFTVQLEVTAPGVSTPGIDRRVFTAIADPTLRPGYPRRLGAGGEAPLRYADLNGDNVPELIVPTEDGSVNAYEPDGSELSGWPVHTGEQASATGHEQTPALKALGAPDEPPRAVVVADLDGNGRPWVITTAGTHIYAWDGHGVPRRGFPVAQSAAFCAPDQESQPLHHPKCGFLASPAVAHLEGFSKPPDIVAPGLDGHLYAFRPDGTPVPGYPIALVDPSVAAGARDVAESINPVAVGDLTGSGHDDIVAATNEEYPSSPSSGDLSGGLQAGVADLLSGVLGGSTRVYAIDGSTGRFLPGWPVKLNGAIQNELPLVGPGQDPAIARLGGREVVVASSTGGAVSEFATDGSLIRDVQQSSFGPASNATDRTLAVNLFESATIGDLTGTGARDIVKYGVSSGKLIDLAATGQNVPYNHLIGAYDALSGQSLPAFPTITDDYQFLSASNIVHVGTAGAANQVLAGTGLGLLHAYDGSTGLDAPGFPRETGGWLYSPAALSGDGRMADITREGYLFEWNQSQPACPAGSLWPSYRHDQQGSGNLDHDGTPPAAPGDLRLRTLGGGRYRLSFRVPGDDGFCGRAAALLARVDGRPLSLGAVPAGGSTLSRAVTLPAGFGTVAVQARDAAGNLGQPAVYRTASSRCLASGARLSARGIGAVRVGMSRAAVVRAVGTPQRASGSVLTYCVRGGGRLVAVLRRARVELVVSTARSLRPFGHGAPAAAVHRHFRLRHLGGRLWAAGTEIFDLTARGRVRLVAVGTRGLVARPARLRLALRTAGAIRRR